MKRRQPLAGKVVIGMLLLQIAEHIAKTVHDGQEDLAGHPYIEHVIAVAEKMPTDELKTIAYLHDTVEDRPDKCSCDFLHDEGFPHEIVAAIEALTKRADENYWDYIRRVADNDRAVEVKLADLAHNADRSRIPNPTPKDEARFKKYDKAIEYLKGVKDFKAKNTSINLDKPPHRFILHRKLYALLQDDYSAMCAAIQQILESASKAVCSSAVVQGRIKNLDSFTEKCARKSSKYGERNFELMTDLCGTRVILHTTAQVADYCELIKKYFDVDWENSEDAGARLGKAEFGYISQHFIVSFRPGVSNMLGVAIDYQRFSGMKAEIQVRTFAQHISADTLHDRMYKTAVAPLQEHEREAARIVAMLENTDAILARFVDKFDRFSLNQTAYLTVCRIEEELSILDAMNYGETYPFTRLMNALKMAEYLRALGRFSQTEALLSPFIDEEKSGDQNLDPLHQARLWFEYGISLLIDAHNRHSAHQWISKALELYEWLEQDRSGKWLETRRFYIFMLLTSGTLAGRKDWLVRVLRMDSANPYACAKLLDHTELEPSLLQAAVATAEEHLRAGINEPEVYFVLGRLHLALKEDDEAFRYYTDGLLFYGAKARLENAERAGSMRENIRVRQILEREIPYLEGRQSGIALAIKELFNRVYQYIYEDAKVGSDKDIWLAAPNQTLSDSAEGHTIRTFKTQLLFDRICEMAGTQGYLFVEEEDIPLVKAALCLGLRVISVNRDMNLRLVADEKIRLTKLLYTLPCDKESFRALFAPRGNGLNASLIEQAAKNGHERYAAERIAEMRNKGRSAPDLGERAAHWDILDPTYKRANINRSAFVPVILAGLGFTLDNNPDGAIGWQDITDQESLARAEHGRWNAERVVDGWCYYPVRDNEKMLHPDLVAFDELSEETKKYDFISMENEIDNFARAGLYLHRPGDGSV